MPGLIDTDTGLALAIQANSSSLAQSKTELSHLKTRINNTQHGDATQQDADAREVANKFEALLIHNMLKSMRKTTMSENTSNSRAIYDDMLDEQLADTMIEKGGLGIADQIVAQIRQQQGRSVEPEKPQSDTQRLRELAIHINRSAPTSSHTSGQGVAAYNTNHSSESANKENLQLAAGLWGDNNQVVSKYDLNSQQKQFVASLTPHAKRNASRLGTSPEAILAIAALETGWGRSMITDAKGNNSHNLFGIKAEQGDNRYATSLTTEYVNGNPLKQHANFKTYANNADAVDGFADFILANPRYSNALKKAGNSEQFLEELQTAGYATDPRYAHKAISIMHQIERN